MFPEPQNPTKNRLSNKPEVTKDSQVEDCYKKDFQQSNEEDSSYSSSKEKEQKQASPVPEGFSWDQLCFGQSMQSPAGTSQQFTLVDAMKAKQEKKYSFTGNRKSFNGESDNEQKQVGSKGKQKRSPDASPTWNKMPVEDAARGEVSPSKIGCV